MAKHRQRGRRKPTYLTYRGPWYSTRDNSWYTMVGSIKLDHIATRLDLYFTKEEACPDQPSRDGMLVLRDCDPDRSGKNPTIHPRACLMFYVSFAVIKRLLLLDAETYANAIHPFVTRLRLGERGDHKGGHLTLKDLGL